MDSAELQEYMIFKPSQGGQRGAILIMLLVMVVIMGLAAGMAGQTWRDTIQRAREAELLWRGQQYQQAIASYYSVNHGAQRMLPAKLEDLVRDPRFPNVVRHMRKLYNDPMTGEEWQLVTDPAERIVGVHSSSDLEPFQKDGFPKTLEQLKGKSTYSEWQFVFAIPRNNKASKPSQIPARKGAEAE